jgi:hypothetical protein
VGGQGKKVEFASREANSDGLIKSPSAALRCDFIVAAHL